MLQERKDPRPLVIAQFVFGRYLVAATVDAPSLKGAPHLVLSGFGGFLLPTMRTGNEELTANNDKAGEFACLRFGPKTNGEESDEKC